MILVPTGNLFCTTLHYIPELISIYYNKDARSRRRSPPPNDPKRNKKNSEKLKQALLVPFPPGAELKPPSSITLSSFPTCDTFFHRTGPEGARSPSPVGNSIKHSQSLRGQLHHRRRRRSPPPRDGDGDEDEVGGVSAVDISLIHT